MKIQTKMAPESPRQTISLGQNLPLPTAYRDGTRRDGTPNLKIIRNQSPVPINTRLASERKCAALIWQNCPPPSMLNPFWEILQAKAQKRALGALISGTPGSYKTGLAELIYQLNEGKSPQIGEGVSIMDNADASKILFTVKTDVEGNQIQEGAALRAVREDKMVIIDEITRSENLDSLMDFIDKITSERKIRSKEPFSVEFNELHTGAGQHHFEAPSLADSQGFFALFTANPDVGQDPRQKKKEHALRDRFQRMTINMPEVLQEDFAHLISLKLSGLPLTTMCSMVGGNPKALPDPDALIELARENPAGNEKKELTALQIAALQNPERTITTANMLGEYLANRQKVLDPDLEATSIQELSAIRNMPGFEDELFKLETENRRESLSTSLRTVEQLINYAEGHGTSLNLALAENKDPLHPKPGRSFLEEQPLSLYQENPLSKAGYRLLLGLKHLEQEAFRNNPTILSGLEILMEPLDGKETNFSNEVRYKADGGIPKVFNLEQDTVIEKETYAIQKQIGEWLKKNYPDHTKDRDIRDIVPLHQLNQEIKLLKKDKEIANEMLHGALDKLRESDPDSIFEWKTLILPNPQAKDENGPMAELYILSSIRGKSLEELYENLRRIAENEVTEEFLYENEEDKKTVQILGAEDRYFIMSKDDKDQMLVIPLTEKGKGFEGLTLQDGANFKLLPTITVKSWKDYEDGELIDKINETLTKANAVHTFDKDDMRLFSPEETEEQKKQRTSQGIEKDPSPPRGKSILRRYPGQVQNQDTSANIKKKKQAAPEPQMG